MSQVFCYGNWKVTTTPILDSLSCDILHHFLLANFVRITKKHAPHPVTVENKTLSINETKQKNNMLKSRKILLTTTSAGEFHLSKCDDYSGLILFKKILTHLNADVLMPLRTKKLNKTLEFSTTSLSSPYFHNPIPSPTSNH